MNVMRQVFKVSAERQKEVQEDLGNDDVSGFIDA
jgi:hypothetical protein